MPGMYQNGFPVGYNTNGLFNPQPTAFTNNQPQQAQASQASQQSGIIWVQGEAGAKSYMMAPNTILPLWDSESQVIYLKSTDASGIPSMRVFEYKERKPESLDDKYISKSEFFDYMDNNLARIVNELKEALGGKPSVPGDEPTEPATK